MNTIFLVNYDSQNQSIKIGFCKSDKESISKKKVFDITTICLKDFSSESLEKLSELIGKTILLTLQRRDLVFRKKFNQRVFSEKKDELISIMGKLADENDVEAILFLAVNSLNESVEQCDRALLDESERLYIKAKDLGSIEAENFLTNQWQDLKTVYLKMIADREDPGGQILT